MNTAQDVQDGFARQFPASPELWAMIQTLHGPEPLAGGRITLTAPAQKPAAAAGPLDLSACGQDGGAWPVNSPEGKKWCWMSLEGAELPAEILKEMRLQRNLLNGLVRGQEKLLEATTESRKCEPHGPLKAEVEPVSGDEARRLFALLRALELESKFRKAPVTRVFLLYCLDGKSRDAVARDCNCSPALITLRLQAIEKKLGRKASSLRQFSDHFERIAESLSDSRARRIDRRRAIEGSVPDGPSDPYDEV